MMIYFNTKQVNSHPAFLKCWRQ